MTRRSFIKALLATGALAIAGSVTLGGDSLDKKLLKLSDYPGVTYKKEYIPYKLCYLHTMEFTSSNGDMWTIHEFSDEFIDDTLINSMLESSIKAGLLA